MRGLPSDSGVPIMYCLCASNHSFTPAATGCQLLETQEGLSQMQFDGTCKLYVWPGESRPVHMSCLGKHVDYFVVCHPKFLKDMLQVPCKWQRFLMLIHPHPQPTSDFVQSIEFLPSLVEAFREAALSR